MKTLFKIIGYLIMAFIAFAIYNSFFGEETKTTYCGDSLTEKIMRRKTVEDYVLRGKNDQIQAQAVLIGSDTAKREWEYSVQLSGSISFLDFKGDRAKVLMQVGDDCESASFVVSPYK